MQMNLFWATFSLIILQRLGELWWPHKNEKYLRQQGAFELGAKNFFWMKLMHFLFFPAMVMEYLVLGQDDYFISLEWIFILLLFAGQILRLSSQWALGRRWTAKVLVWPGHGIVKKGIFRWWTHPNYFAVVLEMAALPLLGGLIACAFIFSFLNFIVLFFRIKIENAALKTMSQE